MSKAKQIIIDGKVINLTQEADSSFNETSENPVQNKVLHSKFNEIEGNFDDVNSTIEDIVDGTTPVAKANVLNTSTKIGVGEAVSSTPQVYTGKNDIVIPIKTLREAYLQWGGKVIQNGISPLDAASDSEFSANRLSFFDADDISIEFSRDAGVNWFPYPTGIGATDFKDKSTEEYYSEDGNLTYLIINPKDKQKLVTSGLQFPYHLGARNPYVLSDRLRITLNTEYNLDICCIIRKALFHVEGTNGQNCLIEGAKFGSPDSFTEIITTEIKGNDGWNSIPIGVEFGAWINQPHKYKKIRITIIPTKENSTYFFINKIRFIGETLRFCKNGDLPFNNHMYTWDIDKNVTFPANVTATNITQITNDISTLNAIINENGSDISKIKNKLFPLEVTLSVSQSSAQEYTGANKDFTISWTTKVDGESVVPSELTLTVGGTIVETDATKTSVTVAANNDKEVKLYVEAEGRNATKTANINFARRYYSAVVDSTWTATNDTVKALAKSALKSTAAATVSYSAATQKKIVFAYPKSHDVMSTIKDAYGNSMFTLNDSGKTFNTAPTTVSVTLSGGATLDYYVYESVITNVVAGNITYTTKKFD